MCQFASFVRQAVGDKSRLLMDVCFGINRLDCAAVQLATLFLTLPTVR